MKKQFFALLFFTVVIVNNSYSQSQPYLLIDNVNTQFTTVSFPYWLKSGQTVNLSTNSQSASIIEFNLNGTNLEFSQAIALTSSQTVPANKVWKIEAIGLVQSNNTSLVNLSNNGSTTSNNSANLPTIFQSPAKFSTRGNYTWKVPPGITSICVEAWGGGGNGGGSTNYYYYGGGGGGGGYGYQCFTVIPGTSYTVTVGGDSSVSSLISATSGENGGQTSLVNNTYIVGDGGLGGTSSASYNISGSSGLQGGYGSSVSNGGKGGPAAGSFFSYGGGGSIGYNVSIGTPGQVIIYW